MQEEDITYMWTGHYASVDLIQYIRFAIRFNPRQFYRTTSKLS